MRLLLAAVLVLPGSAAIADQGRWLAARDAQRIAKKRKEDGELPVAIECRHDPREDETLAKPQVRVRWAANPDGTRWRFKVTARSRANDLLRAAYRQQGYRLVSRDTFSTGMTDRDWMCELWHKLR